MKLKNYNKTIEYIEINMTFNTLLIKVSLQYKRSLITDYELK